MLQQQYNTADSMVVGKFAGEVALAAVGSTTSLTNLILHLFLGLAVGANVVCSMYYGAGNREGLHRAIHTGISAIFSSFSQYPLANSVSPLMSIL